MTLHNQARMRVILLVCAVVVGLLYSTKPLNVDEVFFLHHSWSIAVERASPYSAYPFPVFPAVTAMVFSFFGFYGVLSLKLLACVLAIFFLFRIFRANSVLYSFIGLVAFYLLLSNRFLDIRPELLATLVSLFLLYLLAEFRDRPTGQTRAFVIAWFFLVEILPFISPRYFVFSVFVGSLYLYLNRHRLADLLMLASVALLLVLAVVYAFAGLPPEGFGALVQPNSATPLSTKNHLRQIFGKSVRVLYLLIAVAMMIHVRYGRFLNPATALLFGIILAYIAFDFMIEKVPYRYVAQPTVLLIVAFVYFEFLYRHEVRLGLSVFRDRGLTFRSVAVALLLLFSFLYVRDVGTLSAVLVQWARADSILSCADLPSDTIIRPEKLHPLQHICLAKRICAENAGYTVFADNFRWSPMCLSDRYSGAYWLGQYQRDELVARIEQLPDHRAILNDNGRGVYFYRE